MLRLDFLPASMLYSCFLFKHSLMIPRLFGPYRSSLSHRMFTEAASGHLALDHWSSESSMVGFLINCFSNRKSLIYIRHSSVIGVLFFFFILGNFLPLSFSVGLLISSHGNCISIRYPVLLHADLVWKLFLSVYQRDGVTHVSPPPFAWHSPVWLRVSPRGHADAFSAVEITLPIR